MPGGLLNLIAEGNHNRILTGNPTKTLFKTTYAKHTNFGLQKFRLEYNGQRSLHMDTSSFFEFKVPRHGDLLMDTYLVVTLPTIWSPVIPPDPESSDTTWRPYEFRWIPHIGSQMIKCVRFTIGGQLVQEYPGDYMIQMVERHFDSAKKNLYYKMTGHEEELFDPATYHGSYPHAYYVEATEGPEPSIRGRKLYIPLNSWFSLTSEMAFPLNSLEFNELRIEFEMRPVKELFTIRHVEGDSAEQKSPNFNEPTDAFYRFIHPPPSYYLLADDYEDKRVLWNEDIHLISTYAFLSEEENNVFRNTTQTYLIRQVRCYTFDDIVGSTKIKLDTHGLVSSWIWHFRRNDRDERNEWSNYTNWAYAGQKPHGLESFIEEVFDLDGTPILITGTYKADNEKDIFRSGAIIVDGKARENTMDVGVYEYIEKYGRTSGSYFDGVYCYHFGTKTNLYEAQPYGAFNTSKFKDVEFEIEVFNPPLNPNAIITTICDDDGTLIGIRKTTSDMYIYTFDMTVYEERYNVLTLNSGNASMLFS